MRRAIVLTGLMVVGLAHLVSGQGQTSREGRNRISPFSVPAFAPTQPWKGKVLPDGQPEVAIGIWGAAEPGTRYIDKAPDGVTMASRVVDPPDGMIPYQPWALARKKTQDFDLENPTKPWHIDTQGRCLNSIPRLMHYLTPYTVHQGTGFIAFQFELEHLTRVIRLDGSPHIGSNIKLWMGDSIGRWEGNTLLVDTTNLNAHGRLSSSGDFVSPNVRLKERMTYLDASNMVYEATIEDPTVFTRPWTMRVTHRLVSSPLKPARDLETEIVEYMCYEGEESAGVPSQVPATRP